jgi:lycopene beta-cyclase
MPDDVGDVVDVAIVGAGGAGLSLAIALRAALARRPEARSLSVAVVDPVHRRAQDRTWCWWTTPEDLPAGLAPLLTTAWSRMELIDRAGVAGHYGLDPLRYVMLRSADLYEAADGVLADLGASRVSGAVERVDDGADHAVIQLADRRIAARWVFDSSPAAPRRPGRTQLLQHFRGWTVQFDDPVLDPRLATLMDFRCPQPAGGVAFGYCLPLDSRRGLVEYTEFSSARLPSADYDRALTSYLRMRWDVEPGRGALVGEVENGVIPMTDAPFARQVGRRVFRLGTAGGATRPSTGYTFAALQRQAEAVASQLVQGRTPVPPQPYPARHRWMDAVLLRALARGYLDGADLFTGLFAEHPTQRVVRFLDGASGLAEELAIMRSAPMPAMIRAAAEDAAERAFHRFSTTQSPD